MAGVRSLSFDLVARRVTVNHDLDATDPIAQAIRDAGMRPSLVIPVAGVDQERRLPRSALMIKAVAGVLAIGSEIVAVAIGQEHSPIVAVMAVAAVVLGGRETLRKGWQALRSRRLTMNLLMSVAAIGALAIGQWPEAAVVIWLFGVAELIEALSLERARNAIRSLVHLAPETTHLRDGDAWMDVPTGDVSLGAAILVRRGERVPLDGTVTTGTSTIDQAPITGESVPVTKQPGDIVFAGTINQRGSLEVTPRAPAPSTGSPVRSRPHNPNLPQPNGSSTGSPPSTPRSCSPSRSSSPSSRRSWGPVAGIRGSTGPWSCSCWPARVRW